MVAERKRKVRYAVVGMGHIAQSAVLPAFSHAENAKLQAIVSDDAKKRKEIAAKYNLDQAVAYEDLDDLLNRGDVDAVYIALPNSMHREYVTRAAKAGVHVLCEKPLGVDVDDCQAMIDACQDAGVRLMTAYRLHFEKANMRAVEIVNSGKIGEPRLFSSVFTMNVKEGDIRLRKDLGGGTLYDIGIYCINAARYLFRRARVGASLVRARRG
ncbi:MAG: Gfo/Idh/MocA family oxidoreductase [Pirellulales bacterium]